MTVINEFKSFYNKQNLSKKDKKSRHNLAKLVFVNKKFTRQTKEIDKIIRIVTARKIKHYGPGSQTGLSLSQD